VISASAALINGIVQRRGRISAMRLLDRLRRVLRPYGPRLPADWRDIAGWNVYWERIIELETLRRSHITGADSFVVCRYMVDWVELGHPTRVLVAGNGISALPRLLARAGFAVTALDVSRAATEFARTHEPPDEYWVTGPLVEAVDRPGGSVTYLCGDLFDPGAAPEPFDVIISTSALQGFNDQDLDSAVRALDARLRPGGICRVLVWNSMQRYEEIKRLFVALGYSLGDSPHKSQKRLFCGLGAG
jgi:2-polyprenyl-3-methyl-5-hydroxy-6-metoxy-1,4-benzoquinol methylase